MKSKSEKQSIISIIQLALQEETIVDGSSDLFTIIRTLAPLTVRVSGKPYEIDEDKLVFIGPGKVIKLIEPKEDSGYRLTFPENYFDRNNRDAELLFSRLFFDYEHDIHVVDAVRSREEVRQIINFRVRMFAERSAELYHAALKNHIESVLLEGLLGIPDAVEGIDRSSLSDLNLANNFLILVHRYCKQQISATFYADMLNVTPRKLSKAAQEIFGKSAKHIISDTAAKKAINYIQHSNLSISQIAFEMGFTDESNFRRFIKKQTGKTALEFRP